MTRAFLHILANNLVQNVTNFTVSFALIFWVFLETRSVLATGMIGGIQMVLSAGLAIWFGSLVDHHRKRAAMLISSLSSFLIYAACFLYLRWIPPESIADEYDPALWPFIILVTLGVVAGNIRIIALPTLVTALIPGDRRDKANGLVGLVTGIGFLTTSAISGFLVAKGGMQACLLFALALTALAFFHLMLVRFDEPEPAASAAGERKRVDLKGTIKVVAGVPGLFALIAFTAFNNLLGGVFMALLDAYGLSMMKVQIWGLLWAFFSCAFILSGAMIARTGLGANPLRTLLLVNVAVWTLAALFTIQPSILLLAAGCFLFLLLNPYAEAAEQTTLQKVVPFERQGRVFGFAQAVEQAAAPMTAFLIGPLTQFVFIPFMTTGAGAEAIGSWYGTGPERGIALVFSVTGLLGLAMTLVALRSPHYRRLSEAYRASSRESPSVAASAQAEPAMTSRKVAP